MNEFTNANAEIWFKWLIRRSDNLPGATVYFLSKRNPTSPRFFWLYEHSSSIRIVLFRGFRWGKLDRICLNFVRVFSRVLSAKFKKYQWVHLTDGNANFRVRTNSLIHMDDPTYDFKEINYLEKLWQYKKKHGFDLRLVVTNEFTRSYINEKLKNVDVSIIPQGFHANPQATTKPVAKHEKFSVVYTSANIHYRGDKYDQHSAWGCGHLIDTIIPRISLISPEIQVHLVGSMGENAKKKVEGYENVVCHGMLRTDECVKVLERCHIGIYPRIHDHKRSVQKITEYLGARLPIVSYDLVDASLVRDLNIGIVVSTSHDFVNAIKDLASNSGRREEFISNIDKVHDDYSWHSLARRMDSLFMMPNGH